MTISREQLLAVMPRIRGRVDLWLDPLNAAVAEFGVQHPAEFLAQLAVESLELTRLEENLNYSAKRLMDVWPARFPTLEIATGYANSPAAIAEKVYGGRMGNDPEGSGDGWRYRGRGPIQTTGKENYTRCGAGLGLPLLHEPELLLEPGHGARSAAWYWSTKGCDEIAGDINAVTRKINGGLHGLNERRRYLASALAAEIA